MSDTDPQEPRDPRERPFPYIPSAVPVTVAEADLVPRRVGTRRFLSMADRQPTGEPINDAIARAQAAQRAQAAEDAAEYEAASARYCRALEAHRAAEDAAEKILDDADREYAEAEAGLRRFEQAPGIPWPRYRQQ